MPSMLDVSSDEMVWTCTATVKKPPWAPRNGARCMTPGHCVEVRLARRNGKDVTLRQIGLCRQHEKALALADERGTYAAMLTAWGVR
jgi:hypothetical protein